MGKIIARVRIRQAAVQARRAFEDSPFGRMLTADKAEPGKILKFRRWNPLALHNAACNPGDPLWGVSTAELRQPEEQAKNEAMRQRVDELPMSKQP